MLPQEYKNLTLQRELIDGTVRTIAEIGLENTTTNAICKTCGVNVAYIYRFFADKEDLIAKAFAAVDEEFLGVILKSFTVLHYESIDYESRCRVLFMKCFLCALLLFLLFCQVFKRRPYQAFFRAV